MLKFWRTRKETGKAVNDAQGLSGGSRRVEQERERQQEELQQQEDQEVEQANSPAKSSEGTTKVKTERKTAVAWRAKQASC